MMRYAREKEKKRKKRTGFFFGKLLALLEVFLRELLSFCQTICTNKGDTRYNHSQSLEKLPRKGVSFLFFSKKERKREIER